MKKFNEPELEITKFESEDILTTSTEREEDEMGGMPLSADVIGQLLGK